MFGSEAEKLLFDGWDGEVGFMDFLATVVDGFLDGEVFVVHKKDYEVVDVSAFLHGVSKRPRICYLLERTYSLMTNRCDVVHAETVSVIDISMKGCGDSY
jgi:hypothetical protein